MKKFTLFTLIFFLVASLSLSACHANWQIAIMEGGQEIGQITQEDVAFYLEKSDEEITAVPLGQFLFDHGYTLVEEVSLSKDGDAPISFVWDEVAEAASLTEKGEVLIGNAVYTPTSLSVIASPLSNAIELSIMDIAPTMTYALGLPNLPDAIGEVRVSEKTHHGVMILLDGTQYSTLQTMLTNGELPFLQAIAELQQGLTVYPPITTSASASLLTGAPPQMTQVFGYGYRTTELTTLFDQAAENGKTIFAVEGASLPFNLRNAETTLSGDRDGNGYSDDNVFENALEVIENEMPDLLYIHFHEIDDMGHTYGPDSAEYQSAIVRVDEYLSQIYEALPEDTLIAIFADHGMHATEDGGNHGTLTASDLIIPIIFLEK